MTILSEKPVAVMTGQEPITLQVLVYNALMFASISWKVVYLVPFTAGT